jgi:hypothetical protein
MKLREIFEAPKQGKHVVFCFGRMNPPHYGHGSLINKVQTTAGKGDWFIFTSKSQDPKKNPLPYKDKLAWLRTLFPILSAHLIPNPEIRTYLQAAAYLYAQGYTSATFIAGDADMPMMQPTLEKYNGVESKHGVYNFQPLNFIENVKQTSATSARAAAENNDKEAFAQATQVSNELTVNGMTLFQAVRQGMGIEDEPEKAPDTPEKDLAESSQQKISKRKQQSTAGLNTYGDSEKVSGDYTGYRLGMAVAGADGKTPLDMKAKSWIGKKKSTHPYTKEEQDMLKQAYKAVGASYQDLNHGDMESKELETTETISPVAKRKKNKYGV